MKKTQQRPQTDPPQHIVDAIHHAWPDGVLDMPVDWDDAPFWEVCPRLKAALSHIPRVGIFYEREPEGGSRWDETSNSDEDPPDWHEESRSYHLFFVSSMDERVKFATDTIEPDEQGIEQQFEGEGRIGYAVAVSLVALFAMVRLDQMEFLESGTQSEPDVEPHIFDRDGRKVDPEDYYREFAGGEGCALLKTLHSEIVRIVRACGIAVISEEDLNRPVPWLRASDGVVLGVADEPIMVRDAFFFRSM